MIDRSVIRSRCAKKALIALFAATGVFSALADGESFTFPVAHPANDKYTARLKDGTKTNNVTWGNKVKLTVLQGKVFAITANEMIVARRTLKFKVEPIPLNGWQTSTDPYEETRDLRNNINGNVFNNFTGVSFIEDHTDPDDGMMNGWEWIVPYVRVADLQVDSLNQNPYGGVSGSDEEDAQENPEPGGSAIGKMILCNTAPYSPSSDKPGWADFTAAPPERTPFATMHLFLQGFPVGTQMRLIYDGNDPTQVTQNPDGSWFMPTGTLRVWTKNVQVARTMNDYIQPNAAYSFEDLKAKQAQVADGHFVFYVEGVRGSTQTADQTVKVQVKTPGTAGWVDLDTVSFTFLEVQVLDQDKNPIAKLKVGKMSEPGVLSGSGASATLDIEEDSDRFYLRIPGAAPLGTASLKVATIENILSDYDDDQTEIELEVNGNDMISKSQLLVSDDIDDDHQVDGVADDVKNDRTHRIQLGGKFQVTNIKLAGKDHATDIRTPLIIPKTVGVNIVILRDANQSIGGQPVISETAVWDFWKIVKERFAQVGVKVVVNNVSVEDPPANVDLTDGYLTVSSNNNGRPLAQEAKNLIEAYGTKGNTADITIIYINATIQAGALERAGWAVADWAYQTTDPEYTYNVFIRKDTASPVFGYVVAHELGHLLGLIHTDDSETITLMHMPSIGTNEISDTKRLNVSEETTIRSDSHVN